MEHEHAASNTYSCKLAPFVITHLSNPFGSAGRRTPEQQSNCVGYTKLLLSRIPAESLVVFTDGSAIPNPGPCGAGFSIWRAGICMRVRRVEKAAVAALERSARV